MDETPVWFDMAGNFTIDNRGEKTIQIRETGNEKNRFTVVLTVAAGGGTGTTTSGNFRRARLSDVCGWVKRTWQGIPDEMVIESFKTCRISTSLDGSDDEITDNENSEVGGDTDGDGNYE
ncbi:hypothetical protein RhiirA1_394875 [Rhizophagus irregularis]|uniref:Uncharacterized protein n=1 Tax=Rhizophagus irregularis TaxID=588596 RepID=A0A2N0RRK3_9GLOM|nr:hypothetical protein RhiirA1_394875 [Rhizophagus irregularis]